MFTTERGQTAQAKCAGKRNDSQRGKKLSAEAKRFKAWHRQYQIMNRRNAELKRAIWNLFGGVIQDDANGRAIVTMLAHHFAGRVVVVPDWGRLLLRYAKWLTDDDFADLVLAVEESPRQYSAQAVGDLLGLTSAQRKAWGFTTIRPAGFSQAEWEAHQRANDRQRKAAKARAEGKPTRAEYLAKATTQTRTWEIMGFNCRRTWERHGKPMPQDVSQVLPELSCISATEQPATQAQAEPPAGRRWAQRRDPRTGEVTVLVGTVAWELPDHRVDPDLERPGCFNGYAVYYSPERMAHWRKEYPHIDLESVLIELDAREVSFHPVNDGKRDYRIRAGLKRLNTSGAERPAKRLPAPQRAAA
jgi:hypothetical protein